LPEHEDLDLLIRAARSAGEIALTYSGTSAKRWDKPGGAGPVTEADLAVDTYLKETLTRARPSYGWLSEESEDSTERLSAEHVFIVDPIDGTRSFIEGSDIWAHSIAIARKGRIVAGAVYLPARNRLFTAMLGQGAALNGVPLTSSKAEAARGASILATKQNLQPQFWTHGVVPEFKRSFRASLAYRLALVGQGRFDGMLTFRPTWHWDIAAGSLIASEAGATVTDRVGNALMFNTQDPRSNGLIAAPPALHLNILTAHDAACGPQLPGL
jgi:myo-inositol-1(or 4)-monophosphatase